MIEIYLHLFGKPEWEINGDSAKAEEFKELGKKIQERLEKISNFIQILEEKYWKRSATSYGIIFYKDITRSQAERELKLLNINPEEVDLQEYNDQE